ncbi:hypothetical protein D020_1038B, partial [Vibrio parahaemolyticus SBR10290]
HQCEH